MSSPSTSVGGMGLVSFTAVSVIIGEDVSEHTNVDFPILAELSVRDLGKRPLWHLLLEAASLGAAILASPHGPDRSVPSFAVGQSTL
jgi:hypothetical protein